MNGVCERKDAVFDLDLVDINRQLECVPGDTLYNFECISCYDAPHIDPQDLPLEEQQRKTWGWTFECSWSCYHALNLTALKARSGTHWECVTVNHWQRAMAGTQVSSDWSVSETTNVSIPASALENSSTDLIIVGIALAGVPVLVLIVMLIVHLALRCTAAQKSNKKAPDSSANRSVTVDMTAAKHVPSTSAV